MRGTSSQLLQCDPVQCAVQMLAQWACKNVFDGIFDVCGGVIYVIERCQYCQTPSAAVVPMCQKMHVTAYGTICRNHVDVLKRFMWLFVAGTV